MSGRGLCSRCAKSSASADWRGRAYGSAQRDWPMIPRNTLAVIPLRLCRHLEYWSHRLCWLLLYVDGLTGGDGSLERFRAALHARAGETPPTAREDVYGPVVTRAAIAI